MLNAHQVQVIQNLIGWALDQDHDMHDYPEHLEDLCDGNVDELESIARALADAQDSRAYIRAARDLNENLPDSLPMTDEIRTRADADEVLRVMNEHAEALYREQVASGPEALWLVPAPWDGPELELETDPAPHWDPQCSRAQYVLTELVQLVASTVPGPDSDERAEHELARVLLATGALFARGTGTLSQCVRTALIWERG